MRYEFDYLQVNSVQRPVIPILIGIMNGAHWVQADALVKPNSEYSIFNADILKFIGSKLEEGEKIEIAGNTAYLHPVLIKIHDLDIITKTAFMQNPPANLNILGKSTMLEKFNVQLDELNKKVILEKLL